MTLEAPPRRRAGRRDGSTFAVTCALAAAVGGCPRQPAATDAATPIDAHDALDARRDPTYNVTMFRASRSRAAWADRETTLSPDRVRSPAFGHLWNSPVLDSVTIAGRDFTPHIYATPLFVHDVDVRAGAYAGRRLDLVFVATTNGYLYAINAHDDARGGANVGRGAIVWRQRLGNATVNPSFVPEQSFDGGIALGILSTPAIDLETVPPRIYATSLDGTAGWQAFALDLGTGEVLRDWPVAVTNATVSPVNRNQPARLAAFEHTVQRGALNLSPQGDTLYLGFSSQDWHATGWMVAIDTRTPRVQAAFAVSASGDGDGRGGIWGSGGAAVDADGSVFVTTGNGLEDVGDRPGWWGDSLLRWSPNLTLTGTYSPFNYCVLDRYDMDLGASSPVLFDLDPASTTTPHLIAFGGKQGAAYLLDRDRLPGRTDRRPPCDRAPSEDGSLLGTDAQPHFGMRGPIQVFSPYSSMIAAVDYARMHTTLAYFRNATGDTYLFATGASKVSDADAASVPPGLVRLRVVTTPGRPASLAIDGAETRTTLWNPGPPVLSSDASRGAVVWVLDANQRRSAPLTGPTAARPVLWAFDGETLDVLWRSAASDLFVGGKYAAPTVVDGVVYVATDRLQAFGIR